MLQARPGLQLFVCLLWMCVKSSSIVSFYFHVYLFKFVMYIGMMASLCLILNSLNLQGVHYLPFIYFGEIIYHEIESELDFPKLET